MLEKILLLCDSFENQKIDIREFQKRLETLLIADDEKSITMKELKFAIDNLEEFIFCNQEDDYYQLGMDIVKYFRNDVKGNG